MSPVPPADALAYLDQSIEEAHESLAQLSDALSYVWSCALPDTLPGGKVPPETEGILLAEQRGCQLAAALIRRLERHVRPEMARLQAQYMPREQAQVREKR